MRALPVLHEHRTPRCFLSANYYSRELGAHVEFVDEGSFRLQYAPQLAALPDAAAREAAVAALRREKERRVSAPARRRAREALYRERYVPLLPGVYEHIGVAPELRALVEAVQKAPQDKRRAAVLGAPCVTQRPRGCFALPVLAPEYCDDLLSELAHFEAQGLEKEQPNSMNRRGVLLNELPGMREALDALMARYIQPLAAVLFADDGGETLDHHRSFTVRYDAPDAIEAASPSANAHPSDVDLAYHYDDAEVTLNISLSDEKDYEGGELLFGADKTTDDPAAHRRRSPVRHARGVGILHKGSNMHEAAPVTEGRRINLVMWMRSSKLRAESCPMCGRPAEACSVLEG